MKEHLGCGLCGSVNRQVHWRHEPPFSGIGKHRHLPVVLSPEVYVCLDCCTAELVAPESELRLLVQRDAAETDEDLVLCGGRCRDQELSP